MRISDWSSDVCSSDLLAVLDDDQPGVALLRHMGVDVDTEVERLALRQRIDGIARFDRVDDDLRNRLHRAEGGVALILGPEQHIQILWQLIGGLRGCGRAARSEEHTSEIPSLMRLSYAVVCLKKK